MKISRVFLHQLAGTLVALSFSIGVCAMPANPSTQTSQQPTGETVVFQMIGDEWRNWIRDDNGYAIDRAADGTWFYVLGYTKSGKPVLSGRPAHLPPPPGLQKWLAPALSPAPNSPVTDARSNVNIQIAPRGQFTGQLLFILVDYSNQAGVYTANDFAAQLQGVSAYYRSASYGAVTLNPAQESNGVVNDGVIGWLRLAGNHPDPAGTLGTANQDIARAAIIAADPFVNFAAYDQDGNGVIDARELAVVVIVAGYETSYSNAWAPSVWGHQWAINTNVPRVDGVSVGGENGGRGGYAEFGERHRSAQDNDHRATTGIMAHELGHLLFELPDLYDTDNSSNGVGYFSLMSYGSWGRRMDQTEFGGATPVCLDAWSRYNLRWVSDHDGVGVESFTAAGSLSATFYNTILRGSTPDNREYFLVENRQNLGCDRGLQTQLGASFGGGLAIWHVDDNIFTNVNDAHRLVDLEEADGTENLGQQADLWSGATAVFGPNSIPNSNMYSGATSNVTVSQMSASGEVMSATFGAITTPTEPSTPFAWLVPVLGLILN